MFNINKQYLNLKEDYLFEKVRKKVLLYQKENPEKTIIRLDIGDVSQPLIPAVIEALHRAADEMKDRKTFRGYGPASGYDFLKRAIAENDYRKKGCRIEDDEIFISDGAKSDGSNVQELFSIRNTVGVCSPVYPVYVDTNIMAGRIENIIYMPCTKENRYLPMLPEKMPDLTYLCYPNNPTGSVFTKDQLQKWVDRANEQGAVIIYDAAYEAYVTQENIPRTIYECRGARNCAIELRSFSKNAGFTGLRLGAAVIPKEIKAEGISLHELWKRRQSTKYNGTSYIVQRAGEAVYSKEGKEQIRKQILYYKENANILTEGLKQCGYLVEGGVNSPYVWIKTKNKESSWKAFERFLFQANVSATPGEGFGREGEGYLRFTSFQTHENTKEAVRRISGL